MSYFEKVSMSLIELGSRAMVTISENCEVDNFGLLLSENNHIELENIKIVFYQVFKG